MVISAIWSILAGQNRRPFIRNPVYLHNCQATPPTAYATAFAILKTKNKPYWGTLYIILKSCKKALVTSHSRAERHREDGGGN